MDGSSEMDDLTSFLRQLAADRREDQDRRETDREPRRQDDERLKTQISRILIAELLRFVRLRLVLLVSGLEPLPVQGILFFLFLSFGGWGKMKLKLTTLPRIFIRVVCRFNSDAFAAQR